MPQGTRFALMTYDLELLAEARKLAAADGHTVDALPQDAPAPEDGTYGGILVDLPSAGRHKLARALFLNKLAAVARKFPVLALDRGLTYQEAGLLRAAGIRWLPVLGPRAFALLLAHPLAPAPVAEDAAEEVTAAE